MKFHDYLSILDDNITFNSYTNINISSKLKLLITWHEELELHQNPAKFSHSKKPKIPNWWLHGHNFLKDLKFKF